MQVNFKQHANHCECNKINYFFHSGFFHTGNARACLKDSYQKDTLIAPSSALLNPNDSYCGPSEPDFQPPMDSVEESGMSQVFCCLNTFAQSNYLWYHIAKGHFPPVPFLKDHSRSRVNCSLDSCHWSSHRRFKATGCQ